MVIDNTEADVVFKKNDAFQVAKLPTTISNGLVGGVDCNMSIVSSPSSPLHKIESETVTFEIV